MSIIPTRARLVSCGALLMWMAALPTLADDSEIFQSQALSAGAKPNVLFIIDTSGSMDTLVTTQATYEPSVTYSGSCSDDNLYYSTDDTVPTCNTAGRFQKRLSVCKAARVALDADSTGYWPALGSAREKMGQFDGSTHAWGAISDASSGLVECYSDNGKQGGADASDDKYIQNSGDGFGDSDTGLWDTADLNNRGYRLYSANYLNFRNSHLTVTQTRLQIVRDVAINLAGSLESVNLGLMRYSDDAQGGMVIQAVKDIDLNRSAVISTLKSFSPTSGDGFTPLSETLYEAALYLKGNAVDYGDASSPQLSVDASRTPGNTTAYNSPIAYQCQKSYVVYLTDGLPTHDHDANTAIGSMIGRQCDDPDAPSSGGWEPTDGRCTDDLAEYLYTSDLSSLKGTQSAATYMIGFGKDVQTSVSFLNDVAKAGGTERAYTAADTDTLTAALQKIFSDIQKKSTSFTTPSISIKAFNRAQTREDLYFTVFQAGQGMHWPGNLKKYTLRNGAVVDLKGSPAVDANGFFSLDAQSIWSSEVDGADATRGGAVSKLPAAGLRKIFTFFRSAPASNQWTRHPLDKNNLTDDLLGSGTSTDSCSATCEDTINWARGIDVTDSNANQDTTEQIRFMGDPLHARPGVVSYGGSPSAKDDQDVVVYVPTNDGFLHAIDGKTGVELWAVIPPELLARLTLLRENTPLSGSSSRSYGLDGDVRVLKLDQNQDGVIDPSAHDFVWLFFGMRAGGNHYYALDVTDRNSPVLMWNIGPDELPGIGQTWSPPVITRVNVGGTLYKNSNAQKLVLIFGGGYDTTQENQPYSTDTVGNRVFMVDAESGKLLWYAGNSASGDPRQLSLAQMSNSIPAQVAVVDTNGDTFADRMYVGDMGGRIWRFDIFNAQPPRSLVAGGVLAKLGAGGMSSNPANSTARRFYNAPDVALIRQAGRDPYYNIAIGSGYRGHPLNTLTEERFYSIRDKQPFAHLPQAAYDSMQPILDNDPGLVDITSNPGAIAVTPDQRGWFLRLTSNPGEKVLAQSTTFNNVLLFTTFQPTAPLADDPCYPANINRLYALYATSARAAIDLNGNGRVENNEVSTTVPSNGGIAGNIVIGVGAKDTGDNAALVNGVAVPSPAGGGISRMFWIRKDAH